MVIWHWAVAAREPARYVIPSNAATARTGRPYFKIVSHGILFSPYHLE